MSYDKIVGKRTTSDVGMTVGGGVSFSLGDAAALYFEVRYHYIWGPRYSVTDPTTSKVYSGTANGQFLPIVVGIRVLVAATPNESAPRFLQAAGPSGPADLSPC